jgi:hypothetical protein
MVERIRQDSSPTQLLPYKKQPETIMTYFAGLDRNLSRSLVLIESLGKSLGVDRVAVQRLWHCTGTRYANIAGSIR